MAAIMEVAKLVHCLSLVKLGVRLLYSSNKFVQRLLKFSGWVFRSILTIGFEMLYVHCVVVVVIYKREMNSDSVRGSTALSIIITNNQEVAKAIYVLIRIRYVKVGEELW